MKALVRIVDALEKLLSLLFGIDGGCSCFVSLQCEGVKLLLNFINIPPRNFLD